MSHTSSRGANLPAAFIQVGMIAVDRSLDRGVPRASARDKRRL